MKDDRQNIIYIGKAKNLKKRINQYFASKKSIKTKHLVKKIKDIDFIATKTETEALLLENQMIKKHQPKYNINLKDDKDYPYFCLTTSEKYPKLIIERRITAKKINNKNLYFGPYSSSVYNFSGFLRNVFKIRQCNYNIEKRNHSCIYADIKRCLAPCINKNKNNFEDEYKNAVNNVKLFLNGNTTKLLNELEKQMIKHSSNLDYEKALAIKKQIQQINDFFSNQSVIDINFKKNADYIAFLTEENKVQVNVLFVRGGILIGKKDFSFELNNSSTDFKCDFLKQFYFSQDKIIPDIVFVDLKQSKQNLLKMKNTGKNPVHLNSQSGIFLPSINDEKQDKHLLTIEKEFFKIFKKKIKIQIPKIKMQKQLMEIAMKNAKLNAQIQQMQLSKNKNALEQIRQLLNLEKIPNIIHCFDVSTIQGIFNVGASVCFVDGNPAKNNYRKFNIKSIKTQNDCAMIEEIVFRRYKSALFKKEELPNLMIIDGGKAQLNSAKKSLIKLKLNIPIIALAKKNEEIYMLSKPDPIKIDKNTSAMRLIIRIRNEVHRFAINFHRRKRDGFFITTKHKKT